MPCWVLPADPCTISMQTSRVFGTAAVRASSVRAGTIASSSGSDTAAPMPRSTVRREDGLAGEIHRTGLLLLLLRAPPRAVAGRAGGVDTIVVTASSVCRIWNGTLVTTPMQEARQPVVVRGGIADDRPHRRHVARVELPAEAITQEVLGEGRDEGVGVGQHGACAG